MKIIQTAVAALAASALTALALVGGLAEAQPVVAPTSEKSPSVVGLPRDGELLAARDGEWKGTDPLTYTYRWQRCDANGAACADIPNATAKTYRAVTADAGRRLKVVVTASNTSGSATAASEATVAVARPEGATLLADGRYSIPVTSVKEPYRLVISGVEFRPSVLSSRESFTGRFRVTDTRGYLVRDALVLVTGVPLGWIEQPREQLTGIDGLVTVNLQPTRFLRLVKHGSMVMFIRARRANEDVLAGISSRRLVRVLTARPSSA